MELPIFRLEDYLSQWEFKARYLFCCSDAETFSLRELLSYSDAETQRLWDELKLGYTEDRGMPLLRSEIQKIYSQVPEGGVLTFAGAAEGIFCTFQALLSRGDHVIVVFPCYQALESIPKALGCEVTHLPLSESNHWMLDLDLLEKKIKKNTKLIVINFPHNPTGATLDQKTLTQLVEIARKNGIFIFSDEVYRFLDLEGDQRVPAITDVYEKGISLGVLSKAYGLAGLRVGWIATQDTAVLQSSRWVKQYLSICNSASSEVLALIALRAGERLLERNRSILSRNLDLLDEFFLLHHEHLQWVRPRGGCVGFPRFTWECSVEDFSQQLVQATGILIMPGTVFGLDTCHFRIGFGRANMPEILPIFSDYLSKFRSI